MSWRLVVDSPLDQEHKKALLKGEHMRKENYAKKGRVTPRIKNCIPSSSYLTGIINVLKIGGRFSFGPRR